MGADVICVVDAIICDCSSKTKYPVRRISEFSDKAGADGGFSWNGMRGR